MSTKRPRGFIAGLSLVELLVSMAILGILLAVLSGFLISNQRVTTTQITAATLENDTRLAFLRMSEVISQAQYIFPEGQPLKISGNDFVTGKDALAVLVPSGTAYCKNVKAQSYCGYAFTVEDRSPFEAMLGPDGGTSGLALIETKVTGLVWAEDTIPAKTNSLYTWTDPGTGPKNFYRSPITDSVDSSQTDLSATVKMATYSDFDGGFAFTQNDDDEANGLVAAVESRVYLRRTINNQTLTVNRSNFVFSRAVPRAALPK
jgi:prepilin-type N-terminal cleavage/methylation domain-containing protein